LADPTPVAARQSGFRSPGDHCGDHPQRRRARSPVSSRAAHS
jgi:hypothetical protein